jgi:glutaredoxin 3
MAVLLACGIAFGSRWFGGWSAAAVAAPSGLRVASGLAAIAPVEAAPARVASAGGRPEGQGESPLPSDVERAASTAGDAAPSESAGRVASAAPSASAIVPTSPAHVPSASEVAAAVHSTPVLMFSTGWCPHCKRARAFFQANGISVTDRDIEADRAAAAELKRRTGGKAIPMIDVDGQQLLGFDENVTLQAVASSVERRLAVNGVKLVPAAQN